MFFTIFLPLFFGQLKSSSSVGDNLRNQRNGDNNTNQIEVRETGLRKPSVKLLLSEILSRRLSEIMSGRMSDERKDER